MPPERKKLFSPNRFLSRLTPVRRIDICEDRSPRNNQINEESRWYKYIYARQSCRSTQKYDWERPLCCPGRVAATMTFINSLDAAGGDLCVGIRKNSEGALSAQ
jgi:hypothetical protein